MRIHVIPGTFDGFHQGHKNLIDSVVSFGVPIIVAVNGDEMLKKRKASLLFDEVERMNKIQKEYPSIDVILAKDIEHLKTIISSNKAVVWHGSDYNVKSLSKLYGVETTWWRENGASLCFVTRTEGISSKQLRKPKQVIVVGMYFSGCSLVSGILENFGINMGKHKELHKFREKMMPMYEDEESIALSENLRADLGYIVWDQVDKKTHKNLTDESKEKINKYIHSRGKNTWGLKDQKMLPFLEEFIPLLDNPFVIFVSRDKKDVWKSMEDHKMWGNVKNPELVYNNYMEIIKSVNDKIKGVPALFVDSSSIEDNSIKLVDKIGDFLGIKDREKSYKFFNDYFL